MRWAKWKVGSGVGALVAGLLAPILAGQPGCGDSTQGSVAFLLIPVTGILSGLFVALALHGRRRRVTIPAVAATLVVVTVVDFVLVALAAFSACPP
jgi:hypothetical protein